jgi:predicted transcriptional regulator
MVRIAIMSIKPRYSAQIFARDKTHELRRTPVKIAAGDVVVVYASTPVKAVVGAFSVSSVERGSPASLWASHGSAFGVNAAEYFSYFSGAETGCAIAIGKVVEITPISLERLRATNEGFRPPQSYQWWKGGLRALVGDEEDRVVSELSPPS